ncbi:S41 family peptidase [Rhodanobacter sp. B05]|uniref:S41 family peptidase n=1 Tax=Rhodanobacter sp. B05 TaxID=1945859 RepID=UPI00098767AF|nr:S41 family peptidase [Rhodanobacter sp. B05]
MARVIARRWFIPAGSALFAAMAALTGCSKSPTATPAATAPPTTPSSVTPAAPPPPSSTGAAIATGSGTRLLRFPDVCGAHVAFTYAGDLWTASTQGGTATRLTAAPGLEMAARYSPDCSQIAFTGQYGGDSQVYVVAAGGGEPKQLTWYPAMGPLAQRWGFDNQVYGWTPDGKSVLFRSWRDSRGISSPRVFTVPVSGGLPTVLPMPESGTARFSPDGKQMVYSPKFRDFRDWDRYQGGWAQDLFIYDFAAKTAKNITNDPNTDRDPVWIGKNIYFLSDRGPHLNLYRYDTSDDKTTQLTNYATDDARWASGDQAGQIVYEVTGALHIYDTRNNTDRALVINVPSDLVATRAAERSVKDYIEDFALSSNGKRAAFTARGDIFSVPLEHGISVDLTHTPGVHEREVSWSRDGKRVAYISDQSGEEEVWARDADGSNPVMLTKGVIGRLYDTTWSPDGKNIAFVDSANRIHVVGAAAGATDKVIAQDPGNMPGDYTWSPGGHYLAYSLTDKDTLQPRLYVYDLGAGKATELGREYFNANSPAFSPDGKYLYFLGDREWSPLMSGVELDYASNRSTEILAYALRKDVGNPFAPRNDSATGDDGTKQNNDKGKSGTKPAPVAQVDDRIDFDGIDQRLMHAPVEPDNIRWVAVTSKAILYATSGAPYLGRDSAIPMKIKAWSFKQRKSSTLYTYGKPGGDAGGEGGGGAGPLALSGDGNTLLVHDGKDYKAIDLGADKPEPKDVKLDGLFMRVDPKAEYAEIFNDVWRRYRDYFYVTNMNGYDWDAIRAKYEPLLKDVGDRTDLNYVMGEMIAELSNSHTYVAGGDLDLPDKPHVGLLGADFKLDAASGRYQIANVFPGENDEPRYRSPLTEFGVDVKAGDYILAINGTPLTTDENPYRLLRVAPGQMVQLTVNSRPSTDGARSVLVKPISSEMSLHYYDWVQANRAYVAKASNGTIGYLHIPDMGVDGAREFIKWYYPQLRKAGLIIDVRDNGGGFMSQTMIERLSRKLLAYNYIRGSSITGTYPAATYVGHLAALSNGTSASDGDIFSYMFKQAKLGPLIGTRTWGGVIGIHGLGPLIDGGDVFVPTYAGIVGLDSKYVVEGHGVDPDIEVKENVSEQLAGRDPQLDKAIEVLQQEIKAHPVVLPPQPPGLDKAPPNMRPQNAGTPAH